MNTYSINWREVVGDIDIDLLLSMDSSRLQTIDAITSLDKLDQPTINTIYTQFAMPILKLGDLDRIDWDAVATEVRGITDLWGQIVKPITDAVSGFIDSLKKAVEGIVDPIRRRAEDIWGVVSGIPSALGSVLDTLRRVVVDPIKDALDWVAKNFPDVVTGVQNLIKLVTDNIATLPAKFSGLVEEVKKGLSGLADAITKGLETAKNIITDLPNVISKAISDAVKVVSDLADKAVKGLGDIGKVVGDFLKDLPTRIGNALAEAGKVISGFATEAGKVLEKVANTIKDLPNIISGALAEAGKMLSGWADEAKKILGGVWEKITGLPKLIGDALGEAGKILSGWVDTAKKVLGEVGDKITKLPGLIGDVVSKVGGALEEFRKMVAGAIDTAKNLILDIPRMIGEAGRTVSGFVETAKRVLADIGKTLSDLPRTFSTLADTITRRLTELKDLVAGGLETARRKIGEVGDAISKAIDTVRKSLEDAGKVLSTVIDNITKLPGMIKDAFDRFGKVFEDARKKWDEFIDTIKKIPGIISKKWQEFIDMIAGGVEKVKELLTNLTSVGDYIDKLRQGAEFVWTLIKDFVTNPWKATIKYIINPMLSTFNIPTIPLSNKDIAKYADGAGLPPLILVGGAPDQQQQPWYVQAYESVKDAITWFAGWVYGRAREGFEWLQKKFQEFGQWFIDSLKDVAIKFRDILVGVIRALLSPFLAPVMLTAENVENVVESMLTRSGGVAENLWLAGGLLLPDFWTVTVLPLALRGLARGLGDFEINIEPELLGSKLGSLKWSIRVSELIDAFLKGFEMYYSAYAIGSSMALANIFLVNLQQLYVPRVVAYYDAKIANILSDVLADEISAGAKVNMFLKPVSESALIDYARRMLALSQGLSDEKKLKEVLMTVKAHLKIYGLPAWYIDFLTAHPDQFKIMFPDRFGVERKIYLSHIFELPTHSELARMAQRDVLPGVDVMKRVAWIRGWNEDLTTMTYLLVFKYPSFEKLWQFYMRALSGMLWFEPPDVIKRVFEAEAKQVGAGVPLSTLQLQKALAGPDQAKALELALNTYFKWIEYSNFSWFTEKTEMYGIPIGREIYSKIGGWTADSWIMADIAADIPTKIDMRWMSRYGIFIHMAKKFEEAGVKFESYAPLVEAVPKLIEASAATPIQVDLRWFSKLLQATGLHPAWVPIVTVAENIMAISDEMTLLRTGWLNLFKEGMITVEDAEKYLAGLLTVSYLVGYWDPVAKVWTSGWINLPVRWLPHERRLLQLRMAMDRVLDLYREIYSYIKSGIRTLAITVDDAFNRFKKLVDTLNAHYKKLTKAVTGIEMEVKVDEEYAKLWIELQALAQDIEAVERVRVWWSRVSGWILYRVAYGWVTEEEITSLIETVSRYIPLHKVEVEAYKAIAKALLGIAKKEAIPSPSTLATFAEYMVIETDIVEDVLSKYNVPKEYWGLWKTYISVKPVKADYKSVINVALKALRYGAIAKEDWDKILKVAENYGFTPVELSLLQMRAELELMIDEAKLWRPTLLTLISMVEYVPEARDLLKYYNVDPVFRPIVEKYAYAKPLADEFRSLINTFYRVYLFFEVPTEITKTINDYAKALGFTDEELRLRSFRAWLEWLDDLWREWRLTPARIATLAEYVQIDTEIVDRTLRYAPIPEDEKELWVRYITLRPIKSDYKAVISSALRALRYKAISENDWKKILEDARKYGFTDPEVALLQFRAELELAIENAREYVPTPSMLATLAEYIPAVRKYIRDVFEARRIRGVWAEIWTYYIYLRPVVDEVRRWASAMFRLAEYAIIDIKQLDPVFSILKSYGWEDLEITVIQKTIGANLVYHAFNYIISTPRNLVTMARYTDKAADMAYTRAIRLIDVLPVDQNTKQLLKEMWKEYIMSYQAYPEIRSYMTELINAYAYGVLDDTGLEQELNYLKKLGVPEMRLALVKRTAQLRRARVAARYGS
jgi:phage-related protein/AraC-like DNA-binding protein